MGLVVVMVVPNPSSPPPGTINDRSLKAKGALIVIIVVLVRVLVRVVLANGNLDTLAGKAFAKSRALADAWEFLGRVNLKDVAKTGGQDGSLADVDGAVARLAGGADIYKGKAKARICELAQPIAGESLSRLTGSSPRCGR